MNDHRQRLRHRHRGGNGDSSMRAGRGFTNHEQQKKLPTIRVALAGNPNAGKTSLFNSLTGQHQHIGNYPGVTVDKKSGYVIHRGWKIELVDLPGTYSLSAYSLEEVVTRDFVLTEKPDLIVDVIDSTNLERNLYLCLQFQELGVPVIGALNMTDEIEADGSYIDEVQLSTILGIPFVKTIGSRGQGNDKLLDIIVSIANKELELNGRIINYGREIEAERSKLIDLLSSDKKFAENYAVSWIAVKLLEEDEDAIEKVKNQHPLARLILRRAEESRLGIYRHFREDSVVIVSEQRYAYIHGAVKETLKQPLSSGRIPFTEYVDRIILNRYAGVFIFFFVMFLVYQLTFSIGNPLSDLLDGAFASFGILIASIMPDGVLQDLIVDGIIGGVGGVLVFFPIVMLLFLGLSILEDSGYMARAAFVMDKFFHLFGLHGRSFIPFMIATGCAVPAVMSARNLVNPRDRKITVLVIPLLICGAKSPVVAMLAAAFFPQSAGLVFWLVWVSGWFLAFVIALLFRKTIFRGDAAPFVMELPPYRMPTMRGIMSHMWEKSFAYVRKAGTIILAISIIIWFLLSFPKLPGEEFNYAEKAEKIEQDYIAQLDGNVSISGDEHRRLEADYEQAIKNLDDELARERILFSFAGRVGQFIEPVLKPAGFDWKIGIGLFGGLAAKEVIISTMGIVYGIGDADPDRESGVGEKTPLKMILANDPHYNKAVALSLMFFVLIYVPCAATLGVVRKELGSWKWSGFLAGYTLIVAWLVSTAIYQTATLIGW